MAESIDGTVREALLDVMLEIAEKSSQLKGQITREMIRDESIFKDLGYDSMDAVDAIVHIEKRLKLPPQEQYPTFTTFGDMAQYFSGQYLGTRPK